MGTRYSKVLSRRARAVQAIVTVVALLFAAGCWDREELNKLAMVAGVGIDLADEPGKVALTAQIWKVGEIKTPESATGPGNSAERVWIAKYTGTTVFETGRGWAAKSPRRPYVAHNQVIVLGRDVAESGAQPFLDMFVRAPEARRRVKILIADGKAGDILAARSNLEPVSATELSEILNNQTIRSQAPNTTLQDFLAKMISGTTGPVAPMVSVSPGGQLQLAGTAVFRGDKLAGRLDERETRGLLWVTGEVIGGIINVSLPGTDGMASLEIIRAKSRVTADLKGGRVTIQVRVYEEGNLVEEMTKNARADAGFFTELNYAQEKAIREEILAAIGKARDLNVDMFGFGNVIHRKHPNEWKRLECLWDSLFSQIEVEVSVTTQLRQVGQIVRPAIRDPVRS